MNQQRIAIVEIGGSHDECILSQVIALKNSGCWVVFCSTKEMYERNVHFSKWFDEFHEIILPKKMMGDFFAMRNLNKWFSKNGISKVILNTAQGGHMRNLCLTSHRNVQFFGILHTTKLLEGSFTQNLISKKVKHYFVLNETLKQKIVPPKGMTIHSFYPLNYPSFSKVIEKPTDEFWVTIIGGVEFRRKDLKGFISFAKSTPDTVKFIFLGKSDASHNDVQQFHRLLEEHNLLSKVTLFDTFIDQETFDAYLKKTDGILPLVHPDTPSADEYFNRQISGAINVAFSYGIPMMIHEAYKNWTDFQSGVQFYNLSNQLEQFVDLMQRKKEFEEALQLNPTFSKDFQQEKFAGVILGLSDKSTK